MRANIYFYILIAIFLIALTGMIQLFTKTFPLIYANAIHFCEKTLSNVIITLPPYVPIMIVSIILLVLFIGIIAFIFHAWKTRVYIAKNLKKRVSPNSTLKNIFKHLKLESKVTIIEDDNLVSFSHGLFNPKICISTGLIKKLSSDELQAVLLHESYHINNFDPLKILLSKIASFMSIFLPIIHDFQKNYSLSKEIAADKIAIDHGKKESLITVLEKLLMVTPTVQFSSIAALAESDSLEARILHLTDKNKRSPIRISKKHFAFSAFVVIISALILTTPIHAFAKGSMATHDMNDMNSFCICPFGDDCMLNCIHDRKTQDDINASKNIFYSSVKYK